MKLHWSRTVLVAIAGCAFLPAQSKSGMEDSVGEFRGVARKTKDANPVLSTVEKGPAGLLGALGIGSRKSEGTAPIQVTMSKEQQEDVDRRRKRAEQAELKTRAPRQAASRKIAVVAAGGPTAPVAPAPAIQHPAAPPPVAIISATDLAAITPGTPRADVIKALGSPVAVAALTGLEGGPRETLYYHIDPQHRAMVKLLDGKVQTVVR